MGHFVRWPVSLNGTAPVAMGGVTKLETCLCYRAVVQGSAEVIRSPGRSRTGYCASCACLFGVVHEWRELPSRKRGSRCSDCGQHACGWISETDRHDPSEINPVDSPEVPSHTQRYDKPWLRHWAKSAQGSREQWSVCFSQCSPSYPNLQFSQVAKFLLGPFRTHDPPLAQKWKSHGL